MSNQYDFKDEITDASCLKDGSLAIFNSKKRIGSSLFARLFSYDNSKIGAFILCGLQLFSYLEFKLYF